MTQTDRVDLAVIDGGPRVHRHRIGIVQHLGAGFADLANVLAEIQKRRNRALTVHDAASADRVADTLVDAVLQRNLNVGRERLEPTDADAIHDVARALESLPTISRGGDPRRQFVHLDETVDDLAHHVEIVLVDVGERDLDVLQFRHAQDVHAELLSEANAAGANDRNLQFL